LGKSLAEVRAMPAADLMTWSAYFAGGEADRRADWRAAMLASVIVGCKTGKCPKIESFMPQTPKRVAEPKGGWIRDGREMAERMRAWCKASGGKVVMRDE